MGLFNLNLDNYSSKAFILPADEYELQIGVLKTDVKDIKNGPNAGQKMYMLKVPFKVIATSNGDTTNANKTVTIDYIVDMDRPDGFNRVLKLAQAANGIIPGGVNADDADNEFKTRFGNEDWSVDFEENKLGTAWTMLNQKRVIANVKIGGKTEYQRNEIASVRPI
jgi:hypothetical protein